MFPNRGQTAGSERERKLPQRRKLVPFFRWIAEDPLNCARVVIESDDEIFTARHDQRVIGGIIISGVVMEPVGRR